MSITKEHQQALDDALVLREQRLRIGNCNYRLSTTFKPKEPTFQVALDVLSLTPFYQAFLINASVPPIYMHEFWATVSYHKHNIKFKMNKKNHSFNLETELGYSGNVKSLSDIKVDTLPQPWTTFGIIINKCLNGKVTGLDLLRLSRAQILWGMYHQKYVDYVYLLWEDLVYQFENNVSKKNKDMYYPRFTKVIINHFMSKDQSIQRRNKYGAILPDTLTNQAIKESKTYKTYYDLDTGKVAPKPKYVWQSTREKTEQAPKSSPGKRLKATAKVTKSGKKKQPAQGLETLSEIALSEAEQMKISIERSKTQLHSSHASGSGADEGTSVSPGVPDDDDEEVSISKDDDDDTDDQDDDDGQDDEDLRVQTPSHYESTDDEESDEETQGANAEGEEMDEEETNEEEEVNELYKDVNVNLEGRDTEMTDAPQTNVQGTKLTKDTHVIITTATPEVQQQSSSVSLGFIFNMFNPNPDTGIDSILNLNTELTTLVDVPVTSNAKMPPSSATTPPPLPIPPIQPLQQTPVPTPMIVPSTSLQDLPNFGSLFKFEDRVKVLEENFSEFKQTNQFAAVVSLIPGIVDTYLANKMNEAFKTAVQLQSDRLRDEAQAENADFINKLDDNIKKIIKEQVEVQTSHAIAANLSKLELKKILIDKMESNKSIHRSNQQKTLYKALVDAYESNKLILDTYGDIGTIKRRRDDQDEDEEPSVGSNRGSKRRRAGKEPESTSAPKEKTSKSFGKSKEGSKSHNSSTSKSAQAEEPIHADEDLEEPAHQEFDTRFTKNQPGDETTQHHDCNLAQKEDTRDSFNELMDTPLDFSVFVMNRLKVDILTQELLVGPTFELMKGSCKSLVELEYFLEEVCKATTDKLDWNNPKGQQYPHDLRKPLPLIPNSQGRRVIPFDHFINNDLAYLRGGSLRRTYATSITKTKAADYGHIKWIEDLVPNTIWSPVPIVEWHNYKHLDWITVCRNDDKLYTFKEGDYKRLRLQDIEDMLLLLVQGKLTNLTIKERLALNVSLRMFTRSIVIQRRVSDLKRLPTYSAYPNPKGFIYQNNDKKNKLMRIDELHKFSDGTLNDVRTAFDDILKRIRIKYLPQTYWKKVKPLALGRSSMRKHAEFDESNTYVLERFYTSVRNPIKEILLKLNLPDHMSILTDSQVTPTKHWRMTKPYSSLRFIANCFNARCLKIKVKFTLGSKEFGLEGKAENGLYDELEHEVKEKEEEKSDYPFGLLCSLKKDKVMQQTSEWEKMKLQKNEIASESALGSKNHEKENIVEKHAETNVKTGGDFNEVRMASERYGSNFHKPGTDAFNHFITSSGLNDIPLGGYTYTWVHKEADKMSKLDQFLVLDSVLATFPSLTRVILDKHLSDHQPIFLHELQVDYGPVPFRLYHYWFLIKGFDSFVKQEWKEDKVDERNSMIYLKKKLRLLNKKLRAWGKEARKSLKKKRFEIQFEIRELDKQIDSGQFPIGCNPSIISLIPKISNAKFVKDFRPISLIGCQYKIVGKILANRLSMVIDDLVSSEQSAFIKGRQILDGPMILNEVMSGVTNDEVTRVARLIGCEAAKTPFKYLGVVVGDHMSRSCAWDNVVDRVVSRLSNWKARTLSIGGRLTLIKSVLGSLPTYYFSLFKVPSSMMKKLESLRSCFFCCANDRDKKMAWVSWDKVLSNKKNGVLGVVKSIHGDHGGIDNLVGDGRDSLFWLDPWLEDVPLNCKFPRVYALEENKQVSVGEKLKLGLCVL
ncbi:retrovirus-related pol polyprotein from transposon TNT 1-94 [Tanacetum coccineum]